MGMTFAGPWLRRIQVTLGPLEEWRGLDAGHTLTFTADGTPKSLRISAGISRALMGIPNQSTITLYNLSSNTRNGFRQGVTKITVLAGWANRSLAKLFQGSVVTASSERSGPDIITTVNALPGYGALDRTISTHSFWPGTPVREALKMVAGELPGIRVADPDIKGIIGNISVDGWSCSTTGRQALTELAKSFDFSWHIDNGTFKALGGKAAFGGVVELNHKTNLISVMPSLDGPTQEDTGVRITALLEPGVVPGSLVRVKSDLSPNLNRDYRVQTVNANIDSHGDQWVMEISGFTHCP